MIDLTARTLTADEKTRLWSVRPSQLSVRLCLLAVLLPIGFAAVAGTLFGALVSFAGGAPFSMVPFYLSWRVFGFVAICFAPLILFCGFMGGHHGRKRIFAEIKAGCVDVLVIDFEDARRVEVVPIEGNEKGNRINAMIYTDSLILKANEDRYVLVTTSARDKWKDTLTRLEGFGNQPSSRLTIEQLPKSKRVLRLAWEGDPLVPGESVSHLDIPDRVYHFVSDVVARMADDVRGEHTIGQDPQDTPASFA